jgi:hypothetical protein
VLAVDDTKWTDNGRVEFDYVMCVIEWDVLISRQKYGGWQKGIAVVLTRDDVVSKFFGSR